MKQELENELRKEFPILFGKNKYADFLRGFGFEVNGDGWYELIREFATAAEFHSQINSPVVATIVKEKFGGLRIQGLSNMTDELYEILHKVEEKSYTVCEECGKPGELCGTQYYVSTRCPDHRLTHSGEVMEPTGGFLKAAKDNNIPIDRDTLLTMVRNSPINDLKTIRLGVRGNPDGEMVAFKKEVNDAVRNSGMDGVPEGNYINDKL